MSACFLRYFASRILIRLNILSKHCDPSVFLIRRKPRQSNFRDSSATKN